MFVHIYINVVNTTLLFNLQGRVCTGNLSNPVKASLLLNSPYLLEYLYLQIRYKTITITITANSTGHIDNSIQSPSYTFLCLIAVLILLQSVQIVPTISYSILVNCLEHSLHLANSCSENLFIASPYPIKLFII